MIAKSTSEARYELANDACGEVNLLHRTEIHAVLDEISNMGSRDLGLVTILFFNPRTHRSLSERPFPPPPPRSLASRANYRAARGFEPRKLASLRSNSNCLQIFRPRHPTTVPQLSTSGLVPSNCVFVTRILLHSMDWDETQVKSRAS